MRKITDRFIRQQVALAQKVKPYTITDGIAADLDRGLLDVRRLTARNWLTTIYLAVAAWLRSE